MKTRYIGKLAGVFLLIAALAACSSGGGSGVAIPSAKTSVKLAQTGQTASYDANATKTDDGALQVGVAWPDPRFTVISSGTGTVVNDNLTGLMWLQDANCADTIAYDPDSTGIGYVTWQHALDFVAGINDGTYSSCGAGHTGWRLPNRKELRTLIDYSQYGPALPADHPFSNVQADYYWSSTTSAYDQGDAGVIYIGDGNAGYIGKANNAFVLPVRSGR